MKRISLLEGWTIIDRLHLIRPSTFLINGSKDVCQDFVVKPFFDRINHIKWITIQDVAHCPFWEIRERFMKIVDDFLSL